MKDLIEFIRREIDDIEKSLGKCPNPYDHDHIWLEGYSQAMLNVVNRLKNSEQNNEKN